ncbi:hypothetical protein VNO77_19218 [Canavalia gladiata]|uniref:Uncharacterized protein n=1 Tax=Canavalia gladiata TaxID=3824 RepID=A0AAN9QKA8_CANGL
MHGGQGSLFWKEVLKPSGGVFFFSLTFWVLVNFRERAIGYLVSYGFDQWGGSPVHLLSEVEKENKGPLSFFLLGFFVLEKVFLNRILLGCSKLLSTSSSSNHSCVTGKLVPHVIRSWSRTDYVWSLLAFILDFVFDGKKFIASVAMLIMLITQRWTTAFLPCNLSLLIESDWAMLHFGIEIEPCVGRAISSH